MRRLKPATAIDAIHAAGGLAVWAHPYFDDVDAHLADMVQVGLDGIEAFRPALTGNEQLYVEMAAEHFDLFMTGGSDCHARGASDQPGWYTVERSLLEDFFEALLARTATGVLHGRGAAG
jgi:predicted metal-dependent phosphoesterase TrpH